MDSNLFESEVTVDLIIILFFIIFIINMSTKEADLEGSDKIVNPKVISGKNNIY